MLSEELVEVEHQVVAVELRQLMASPSVVHRDRLEVADLNADIAAHAPSVVDPELVDDLAPLAFIISVQRVVLHRDRHALDGTGALASVAACAERLDDVLVPEEDWERAVALRDVAVLRRILELERNRLYKLLEKFIEAELKRTAFSVDRVEYELDYQQFGVRLNLRIDRIDRLPDESMLIADYKTGQPKNLLKRDGEPRELQLVVYACALDERIGGLVLMNIDSRTILYKGTGASGEWDAKGAGIWPQRLAAWKAGVDAAMQQIAEGDARINLDLPSDQTRPLNILSRFEERRRG